MNEIELALAKLTDQQKRKVLRAFDAFSQGAIERDHFIRIVSNIIVNGNARAYLIGAAIARRTIEDATGEVDLLPPPAYGTQHLQVAKVEHAIVTILAEEALDTAMQLERLTTASAATAAADGGSDVVKHSKRVRGWVRALDADACQLCRWWWREGRVWDPTHPMPRHTGCLCQPKPIVKTTTNFQSANQAQARRDERNRA